MRSREQEIWDQIFLLVLFACSREALDNLKIQKVIFVSEDEARKEQIRAAYFPFYRNKYGPYSSVIANDVRKLEDSCFIDAESRQLLDRGRYILEYIQDDLEKSPQAQHSLAILCEVYKKYADSSSFKLKDEVYDRDVAVAGLRGEIMKVRDIPMRTAIIHPALERLNEFSPFPDDLIEDLYIEFGLTQYDLDPESPANIAIAREVLAKALRV